MPKSITLPRETAILPQLAEATPRSRLTHLGAPLVAFLAGLVLLYGVAFAQTPAAHSAAHDTRHAFAFPCH